MENTIEKLVECLGLVENRQVIALLTMAIEILRNEEEENEIHV